MSYFHASWERQEDIERVDAQAKMKIKRFMQAPQAKGILGTKVRVCVFINGEEERKRVREWMNERKRKRKRNKKR